jgi:hypothetical protein
MVKTKPNQKIHVNKLQTAFDKLEQLESKPVQELTLRESIYFLRDKLKSALKKGYSYQDLSEILEEQQILVSAATLKQYLTDIGKKSSSRKKRTKSSSKTSTNVTSSKEELAPSLSEVETNKIKEVELAEKTVNLDSESLSETKQSSDSTNKKSAKEQSKSIKPTKTKFKGLLSDLDDDLSSEFNHY